MQAFFFFAALCVMSPRFFNQGSFPGMGQYVFDIAELPPEMQIGDQPVLVAGNIEHMQITDLVHTAKRLPQLGEIGIVHDLHHLAPSL